MAKWLNNRLGMPDRTIFVFFNLNPLPRSGFSQTYSFFTSRFLA